MNEENVMKKLWLACIYNQTCERLLQIFTGELEEPGREEVAILQRLQDIPISSGLGKFLDETVKSTEINLETLKTIGQGYEDWQSFEEFKVSAK